MIFLTNRNWMFLNFTIFIKPISVNHFTMFKDHVWGFLCFVCVCFSKILFKILTVHNISWCMSEQAVLENVLLSLADYVACLGQ